MDFSISASFDKFYRGELLMRNRSKKTAESYDNASKLLVSFFGDIAIIDLKLEDVMDWHEHLSTWQKPDTVRGNICCLRMVLKYLAKRGFPVMDFDEIPVAKREKRLISYLTEGEADMFLAEIAEKKRGYSTENRLRNIAIARLIYASGIRNSEVCALNRNSIKNRQFTVVGKSKDPRLCFIDEDTDKAIEAYLAVRSDKERALFISVQTGKRVKPGNLRRIFSRVCRISDFEGVHPHTMRHSFGTKMLERSVDLRYIGDMMGHVSLDTTKLYTHYTNRKLREVYEKAHAY